MNAELGVVLMGPPGVGKGTQAARLRERFGLDHVSTGDLLRDHATRGTELGREAAWYTLAGELVPDEIVVAMVRERVAASSRVLLDGFPRTLAQACALADLMRGLRRRRVAAAILLDAPDAVVTSRIADRADVRGDDDPETVRHRLALFRKTSPATVSYYSVQGVLHRVDGCRPVDAVFDSLSGILRDIGAQDAGTPIAEPA
jgi:adenylate kinase